MAKFSAQLNRLFGIVFLAGAYPAGVALEINFSWCSSTNCPGNKGIGILLFGLMIATGVFFIALSKDSSKDNVFKWFTISLSGLSLATILGFVFSVFGKDPWSSYYSFYRFLPFVITLISTLLWIVYFFKGRKYVKGLGFIKVR